MAYRKVSIPMGNIKGNIKEDPKLNSLLKLFFYRQITYEFSAYANKFVIIEDATMKLNVTEKLISLISIRAGIALVIFFICRVLLKLYRYCLQFSAFYTGLFDAFFIQENANLKLDDAIKAFAIKNTIEGGEKSPTDEAMELVKTGKEFMKSSGIETKPASAGL